MRPSPTPAGRLAPPIVATGWKLLMWIAIGLGIFFRGYNIERKI